MSAEVAGRAREEKQLSAPSGGTETVDFEWDVAKRVAGRVVGPDDVPLSLRFLVVTWVGWRSNGTIPDHLRDATPHSSDSSIAAVAVSGPDGKFEVLGLEGSFSFVSYDEGWWLEVERDAAAAEEVGDPERRILVRASPAFRAVVDVVPADRADDRTKWKSVSGFFELPFQSVGLGGFEPPLVMRGPIPEEYVSKGFSGRVVVDTAEHRREGKALSFGPGHWAQRVEVPLTRFSPSELGTVVVRVGVPGLVKQRGLLQLLQQRKLDLRNSVGDWFWLEPRGADEWTTSIHAGPAQPLELFMHSLPLGELVRWKGTVDVVAQRETVLTFPAVPTGRVVVRFPPEIVGTKVYFSLSRREPTSTQAIWEGNATADPLAVPAVPVGPWTAQLQFGTQFPKREIHVRGDAETIVDFGS